MLKLFKSTILIFLLSSLAHSKDAADILKKMDEVRNYDTAKMEATMKIVDRKGNETVMSLISYEKKQGDKTLMRFTAPARLKGTSILTVEDNIWYYNNRTNRVRLLSKSAKKGSMMGSSFSYEDMTTNYVKDYTASVISEKNDYYILKMVPKDQDKNYAYLKANVLKDKYVAVKVEYYNDNDLLYKKLLSDKIKNIDDHLVPLVISMQEIGSQKTTYFEIKENSIEFDIKLDDNIFSERYLKK